MNAGNDYKTATAHAQANADRSGEAWVIHGGPGATSTWWITPISSYFHSLPTGATVIPPRRTQKKGPDRED